MQAHHRIYGVFFLFAIAMGALLARLPDLQRELGLTEGQLGLTLISMSIGALLGLTFSNPLIVKLGARRTAFITVLAPTVLYTIIPFMPNAYAVAPLFFFAGLFAGALEINVNIETDRLEAQLGRRIMSRAHGMWSLGFFVTALIAAGLRQAGVSIEAHMIGVLIVTLVGAWFVFSGIENAPPRADSHVGDTPLIAFPTWALAPLCLIGASPLLVEGAGIDWSGIYMRDVFEVAPFVGGMSVTLFTLFMAIARLSMDPVVERLGPRLVAGGLLCVATLGLVIVALAPNAYLALIGFTLMGIGCSSVYPLAVSAAAQRTDRPATVNVAALGQMTFVVFFVGPPLLGFVAEHFGIRTSYWVCVLPIIASLLVIRALSSRPMVIRGEPEPATPHG